MRPLTGFWLKTELRAQALREGSGLEPVGPVDPLDIIDALDNVVVYEGFSCLGLPCDHATKEVSAFATTSGGVWHIVLNNTHQPERVRISLMEEIAHILLEHPPTVLTPRGNSGRNRTRDAKIEEEAYALGAATLVPYSELFRLVVQKNRTFAQVAAYYRVSPQLVEYRCKVTGVWRRLKAGKRLEHAKGIEFNTSSVSPK